MPLIIAHRGASAYAPENTLAAFALAHRQGADMIELDVQRSVDGTLVVFHDDTLERWDGTRRLAAACTWAELQALDIGGEKVATLAETLAFARETGTALNVEIKQPGIAAEVAALINEFGLAETTVVSSFHESELRAMQQVAPAVQRGYLMGHDTYRPDVRARELWPFLALKQVAAAAWHPTWELPLVQQVIPLVRRAGYAVNVWTVDEPALMVRLARLGATGIITNKPDVAREVLREL
jgi:glycerophosphoryl diester phosphodiesterase